MTAQNISTKVIKFTERQLPDTKNVCSTKLPFYKGGLMYC